MFLELQDGRQVVDSSKFWKFEKCTSKNDSEVTCEIYGRLLAPKEKNSNISDYEYGHKVRLATFHNEVQGDIVFQNLLHLLANEGKTHLSFYQFPDDQGSKN